MMESSERPHRTGDLFICFTSRFTSSSSSSSMKISSKSILSPGRARDAPVSLSASLSRKLRNNGSLKGGQSPMFPTAGKKRGSAFEHPEPSSPKVTCIGQVRVKTKKQGKKKHTLSKRRSGEVSFRRIDQNREGLNPNQQQKCLPHRNQRWVHLPLTICEALRAFAAEFSCLFPCRSSCLSMTEREKEEKPPLVTASENEGTGGSSCGPVFARWLVAFQEERTETRRERAVPRERTLTRHVVDETDFNIDEYLEVKDGFVEEEEKGGVSICVPPKNALLLMRCRSDPTRMSALANRFWDSHPPKVEEDDGEEEEERDDHEMEDEDAEVEVMEDDTRLMHDRGIEASEILVSVEDNGEEEQENREAKNFLMEEERGNPEMELEIVEELQKEDEEKLEPVVQEVKVEAEAEQNEALVDPEQRLENGDEEDDLKWFIEREEEEPRTLSHHSCLVVSEHLDSGEEEEEEEEALEEETEERSTEEKETQETSESGGGESRESEDREKATVERESEVREAVLPDCLLLMMCEPKLSMEVSKETWVCSTDFIRWLPERRPVNAKDGLDGPKKRISTDSIPPLPAQNAASNHHPHQQPPRSSCSLPAPAAVSMATMIEHKLVNAVAYEPFVLTRCKSEPMRTAAAKLAPETCFWNNRKLEPHRRSAFGIGEAGVGF